MKHVRMYVCTYELYMYVRMCVWYVCMLMCMHACVVHIRDWKIANQFHERKLFSAML